jgi:hypothetical protein
MTGTLGVWKGGEVAWKFANMPSQVKHANAVNVDVAQLEPVSGS